jgi:hypothetical protein
VSREQRGIALDRRIVQGAAPSIVQGSRFDASFNAASVDVALSRSYMERSARYTGRAPGCYPGKEMLQAQIDIVDEAGHTEESVTILGSGRVSLGTRQTGGYLHADEAAPDLAVIVHDGERISIDVKVANSLQRDNAFIAKGSFLFSFVQPAVVAFILQLRRYVKVKQTVVSGELMSGGAVIHSPPSSLVSRAHASIARGAIEVARELQELRDQGKIDEHGNLLVPWPDDMKPDSSTDL